MSASTSNNLPCLYSFRRCPYAMRARMAIRASQLQVELREVVLKNKPAEMLEASPKATVPVLVTEQNQVIDESLDIMHWSLQQNDPYQWLRPEHAEVTEKLIRYNDNIFKIHLDHYKYFERFPEQPQISYREKGEQFLAQLEQQLCNTRYLVDDHASLADIAIFPFIRQFAHVDLDWFNHSKYTALNQWLNEWLNSDLFTSVMHKHPPWDKHRDKHQKTILL